MSRKRGSGRPFPLKHGARSDVTVSRRAGYEKKGLLQPLHLRQKDLSLEGRYWLNEWAKVSAQVYLMSTWADENGWIDDDGKPALVLHHFFAAQNAKSRLYARLRPFIEEALGHHRDPVESLRAYLAGDES
jgi:hypothetical protein